MAVFDRRIKHKNGTVSVMRYITWYLPGSGTAVTRSLGPASKITKTRAKAILAKENADAKKNKHGSDDPKLSEYVEQYIKYARDIRQKRSWQRDQISLNHITNAMGSYNLSEITPDKLIQYQGKRLDAGRKPRTVNLELACLKRLYNIARLQNRYQGDNPVTQVKFLEQSYGSDRILTPEEEKRLLQASPIYLRNIIICALNTGMRRGEILTLKWENVNLEHEYFLLESSTTKTKKSRRVPINSTLKEMLTELESNQESKYVFTNSLGKEYLNGHAVAFIFQATMKRATIKGFRFHDLRHTAATRMVEAGVPLFTVGQILGHSDPKTTMRYAHPDESLKQGVEALARYNRDNYQDTKKTASKGKRAK